jgi:hypothetical protein
MRSADVGRARPACGGQYWPQPRALLGDYLTIVLAVVLVVALLAEDWIIL